MTGGADLGLAHLRVARPTDGLEAVVRFYRDGLGLDLLYEFRDHDGFDGVMLGRKGAGYHLEFTRKAGHKAGKAPTEDNLLVFYLPALCAISSNLESRVFAGFRGLAAFPAGWPDPLKRPLLLGTPGFPGVFRRLSVRKSRKVQPCWTRASFTSALCVG